MAWRIDFYRAGDIARGGGVADVLIIKQPAGVSVLVKQAANFCEVIFRRRFRFLFTRAGLRALRAKRVIWQRSGQRGNNPSLLVNSA